MGATCATQTFAGAGAQEDRERSSAGRGPPRDLPLAQDGTDQSGAGRTGPAPRRKTGPNQVVAVLPDHFDALETYPELGAVQLFE
jgi:hypothetical protein